MRGRPRRLWSPLWQLTLLTSRPWDGSGVRAIGPIAKVTFSLGVFSAVPAKGGDPQFPDIVPLWELCRQTDLSNVLQPTFWSCRSPWKATDMFWSVRIISLNSFICIPSQIKKATTFAECHFQNYILEHGLMELLQTDRGRQFESDTVKCLCRMLGVKKTHTTPYNPKSDGIVERFNRTLEDQLAKTPVMSHNLSQVAFAYNTCIHSSTAFTYFLTHERPKHLWMWCWGRWHKTA